MHPKFITIVIQGHHGQWYAEDPGPPGVLGRMAIYFQGAVEHWQLFSGIWGASSVLGI